jgi:hypothetical protein
VQSAAPLVIAFVVVWASDRTAFAVAAALAGLALACFLAVRVPPFTARQG